MINKTFKDLIQEFHYFKNESKLDSNSIKRIDKLESILISTMDYYSSIDNKYIEDINKDLINKINSNLNVCIINKKRILSEMDNYSLNFGNIKLDEYEYRIKEYNNLLKDLNRIYIDTIASETNYNNQDMINLYNDCINSINSNNINFLGQKLDEYSNNRHQKKLISKLYSYISEKNFIATFSSIVKLRTDIDNDKEYISKLKFIKNNKKYIELYDSISNSSSIDLNYIIEKSYICDDLNSKLNNRNKNRILNKKIFNIFYSRLNKRINSEEKDISRRHIEYKKKEKYLNKLTNYFKNNGHNMEDVINYLWLDNEMLDNKINNINYNIKEKEELLSSSISNLSKEDKELYDNNYSTIQNIITNLCNNPSNMVNIYILYLLSNLDIIINNNKEECYDDYKTNGIVSKYKNNCNSRINEIDSHNSIQKIKTR